MAMTAMAAPGSHPKEVARQLGMTTTTLYTYINGDGSLKEPSQRLLDEHLSAVAFRSSAQKQGGSKAESHQVDMKRRAPNSSTSCGHGWAWWETDFGTHDGTKQERRTMA